MIGLLRELSLCSKFTQNLPFNDLQRLAMIRTYSTCLLRGPIDIELQDGKETILKASAGQPQVRVSPDFSTGYIEVTQLSSSQKTVIPERSVLLAEELDKCLVKHKERIRLAKNVYYEVDFPPCDNAPAARGSPLK
ncbi:bifunctional polynucleotide phosphatase/kinase-like, partial [Tropilaelaps mercedesae]